MSSLDDSTQHTGKYRQWPANRQEFRRKSKGPVQRSLDISLDSYTPRAGSLSVHWGEPSAPYL